MNYMILENNIIIDEVNYGDFIFINEVTDTFANVNISNTEIYLRVPLSSIGLEESIKSFFKNKVEV